MLLEIDLVASVGDVRSVYAYIVDYRPLYRISHWTCKRYWTKSICTYCFSAWVQRVSVIHRKIQAVPFSSLVSRALVCQRKANGSKRRYWQESAFTKRRLRRVYALLWSFWNACTAYTTTDGCARATTEYCYWVRLLTKRQILFCLRYADCLHDCVQLYVQQREALIGPSIQATITQLVQKQDKSTCTLVD